MLHSVLRSSLVLAALGVVLLLVFVKRTDEPAVACATANPADSDYKMLVVGESWAAGGKFFPELPAAVSARLGGRGVHACSVGFSGRNSKLLYYELVEKFPKEELYRLFKGVAPDKVIFMTGVNDIIQHVGAWNYVDYTKKLVDYFVEVQDVEVISIPRVNEKYYTPTNVYSKLKRTILRCIHDGCDYRVNDVYRIALMRDHPDLPTIEYDNFIDRFEGHEECYTLDGVHLTNECLHKYGTFIGKAMAIKSGALARN
jgi:lysophospholipase L1-like esterase